jgi:hypothetical protein
MDLTKIAKFLAFPLVAVKVWESAERVDIPGVRLRCVYAPEEVSAF